MDTQNNHAVAPLWAVTVPDRPLEWFYPSVFVRGELNGIQGIPGDGKTWLMCELAAQTSIGGIVQGVCDEADRAKLPCGNVLYLSGDDAPERLKERLTSLGGNLSKIAFAPEGSLPQIGSPEMTGLFAQTRPTFCIIDTLQHFINGASANDMSAITAALHPLQLLARQHNTAVVVIMHVSKFAAQGNAGDSTSFSIGSYAIAGIFRTLWTLGRLKEENGKPAATRALCVSKNNYAEFDPPALLFELRKGFRWVGVDYEQEAAAKTQRRQLAKNQKRHAELDTVISKLFEQNATGKITDSRFETLLAGYEKEQAELADEIVKLQAELEGFDTDSVRADKFIKIVEKYTDFTELTTPMIHEFVEKIIVYEAEKSNGERTQQVDIYLNFIGKFDVPLPEPTPEEIAAAEKLQRQRERKRVNYQRYVEKRQREMAQENMAQVM